MMKPQYKHIIQEVAENTHELLMLQGKPLRRNETRTLAIGFLSELNRLMENDYGKKQ